MYLGRFISAGSGDGGVTNKTNLCTVIARVDRLWYCCAIIPVYDTSVRVVLLRTCKTWPS